ncbi:integrase [Photorhabdus luminescens]|nr:integrase [Photorhabdus luminescens]
MSSPVKRQSHPLTLRQHLDAYLDNLLLQGASQKSQSARHERLSPFVSWCEEQGVISAAQVTEPLLANWQQYLARYRKAGGQPYTPDSQRRRLRSLRLWFDWLQQQHAIPTSPATTLASPDRKKRPSVMETHGQPDAIPARFATLRQHLAAWLEAVQGQGLSERTQEAYEERLLPFVTWCEARGVMTAPQVSLPLLESYQRWLRSYRKTNGQPYSPGSQRDRLSVLRQWFRWLLQRHHILYNPTDNMVLPREEKRLPAQVMNEDETHTVLAAANIDTLTGLRNRVILEVLWSTGIRRMEVANLLLSEVDFGRGVVLVRQGKGNKDRVVPIGEQALHWLSRWLSVRPELTRRGDSGHLFITKKGRGLARGTLTQIAADSIRKQAQLAKPGACHLFRHSMATQMLENGADTRHIQAILGHEKLETTQIYTRVAIGHLKEVHEQTHPAERQSKQATLPDDKQANSNKPDSPKPD